jgi:hypothetical protein
MCNVGANIEDISFPGRYFKEMLYYNISDGTLKGTLSKQKITIVVIAPGEIAVNGLTLPQCTHICSMTHKDTLYRT